MQLTEKWEINVSFTMTKLIGNKFNEKLIDNIKFIDHVQLA